MDHSLRAAASVRGSPADVAALASGNAFKAEWLRILMLLVTLNDNQLVNQRACA